MLSKSALDFGRPKRPIQSKSDDMGMAEVHIHISQFVDVALPDDR
jgi:hypothetical protein